MENLCQHAGARLAVSWIHEDLGETCSVKMRGCVVMQNTEEVALLHKGLLHLTGLWSYPSDVQLLRVSWCNSSKARWGQFFIDFSTWNSQPNDRIKGRRLFLWLSIQQIFIGESTSGGLMRKKTCFLTLKNFQGNPWETHNSPWEQASWTVSVIYVCWALPIVNPHDIWSWT